MVSCTLFIASVAFSYINVSAAVLLLVAASAFSFKAVNSKNLIQLVWFSSYSIFCLVPLIIVFVLGRDFDIHIFHYLFLSSCFFYFLTRNISFDLENYVSGKFVSPGLYFAFSLISLPVVYFVGPIAFFTIAGFMVYNIYQKYRCGYGSVFLYILCYLMVFIFYVFFVWDGFGRLLLFGYLLPLYFLAIHHYRLPCTKLVMFFLLPIASILATFIRFRQATLNEILEFSAQDSVVAPYIMVETIAKRFDSNNFSGFYGVIEQILASILFLVPRGLWSDKPYAFGFQYTLNHDQQNLIDAGHSYAGFFFGENIYYLGWFGYIFSFLYLFFIVSLFKFWHKAFGLSVSIVMLMWLMTFYWGGLATFSQRFIMSMLLILIFIVLSKIGTRPGRVHS